MNRNAKRKGAKRWGAFDDEWNLIVYGDTERECRKALTEYRNHAISLTEPTYRIMEYYDEN